MRSHPARVLSVSQLGWQELKETLARTVATSCSSSTHLRQLHARIVSMGLRHNIHLCGLLIGRYSTFSDLAAARAVFFSLDPRPQKALVWNALMRGCLQNDRPDLALNVYNEMTTGFPCCMPDRISFNLAIKACVDAREFQLGFDIAEIIRSRGLESDPLVSTPLLVLLSRSGDITGAREMFDKMSTRDVVSWNAMITAYAQEKSFHDAINLFKDMKADDAVAPSPSTLVTLVSLCGKAGSLEQGKTFHGEAIRSGFTSDISLLNALMEMYVRCNSINSASVLFGKMPHRDSISWSTIIGGHLHHQRPHCSLALFRRMISSGHISPTKPILLNVLLACADLGDWREGKEIEAHFMGNQVTSDAELATTLIFMYAKCGRTDTALDFMNMIATDDVIGWNAIIRGCAESGNFLKAGELYTKMQRRGVAPDMVTLLTLISLSSLIPSPIMGMTVHGHVLRRGLSADRPILNSLIEMYSRCGNADHSRMIFDGIEDKDVVAWTSMMNAYAHNGGVPEVLTVFKLMKGSGVMPNHFTFLSALSACCRGGYVDEAHGVFKSMREDYRLEPCIEHYACMVGLLGRAGYTSEASALIEGAPAEVSESSFLWGNLLSACSLRGDLVVGEAAAKRLFLLEPLNAANYIALANIYVSAGRRDDANRVLGLMREAGLEKNPGYSQLMAGL